MSSVDAIAGRDRDNLPNDVFARKVKRLGTFTAGREDIIKCIIPQDVESWIVWKTV